MTENIQKTDKTGQNNDLIMLEDLERRFGPAMAQQIMDELKKAENHKKVASEINYMGAKALSEASEMYRREAQTALHRYKDWKSDSEIALKDVVGIEGVLLKKEFQRNFNFYRRFNKGFFTIYRQAMKTYKTGTYVPYKTKKISLDEVWQNTVMAVAA